MISHTADKSGLLLDESFYSGKINAAFEAYGGKYDFCRFYRLDSGSLLMYNSSAVISGEGTPDELSGFIMMNSPQSVECPKALGESLSLSGYEKRRRTAFELMITPDESGFPEEAVLMKMYDIVSRSFGEIPLDLWYADMSHRIRHGVSKAYMLGENACACTEFIYSNAAYISQVAVLSEHRGKGLARQLLRQLGNALAPNVTHIRLWAYDDAADFYRHMGFSEIGEDNIYLKKEII